MKTFLKFRFFSLIVVLGTLLTACGDDSPSNEPSQPITPVTPSEDKAMTSGEQKDYLEKVALEFMDLMPSSDFEKISDLGDYLMNNYGEDYDWEDVGDWAADLWNDLREAIGTKTSETDRWGYTYVYTNYKAVVMASNFTGHFTARNGRWIRTDANDLQFIFTDQNGKQCVLALSTSGNVKKVHAFDVDDWTGWSGSTEYYDRTACTVGVPENIVVSLNQGGEQVIKATVKINLNSLSGDEFDLSKNNFTVESTTELNNGYQFIVSQATYEGNKKATANFTMKKNGRTMVVAAASSDLSGIPACNVSAFAADNFDIENYNTDNANAKSPFVKLDILGKVQIQGQLKDIRKIIEYCDAAEDNNDKESTFKSYINQANALTDVNLFYDGNATKQATIKLEPFFEDTWYEKYWTAEPVIVFYDGSSYSTFDAFFNETNFKRTIDAFKRLSNRYAGLIDEHIDW